MIGGSIIYQSVEQKELATSLVPTLLRGNAYSPDIWHRMHSHRGRREREKNLNWMRRQLVRITYKLVIRS